MDNPAVETAVVTGAGRGLGRLVAERLASRGFAVCITDIDAASAEDAARAIGRGAWAMAQDVRDPESHRAVARAAAERGPVKVWVNNAGVLRSGTAWGHSDADVKIQIDVNVLGVMWGSRAAVEAMRASGGHIINIASISALTPVPGLAVYAASKHAVLGFSTSLQGDLERDKLPIKVSALCPDAIETDLVRNVQDDEHSALLFSNGKLLRPEAVADVVNGLLDRYHLVLVHPRRRGALAHLFAPFPGVGLKILRGYHLLGERNRRRREQRA
jgi:NAD(P)-dependent dehydrogenase (short-subunit alcohol dehydrogenase family)